MARCNFAINFSGSAEALVGKANTALKQANGTFDGDTEGGNFSISTPIGSVRGSYQINDSVITMEITEKPIFLSCSKIQAELQKYLLD